MSDRSQSAPQPESNGGTDSSIANTNKRLLVCEGEAAQILGISPRTLFDLRKAKQVPAARIGSRVLYRIADLEEFAARASTFESDGEVA